MITDLSYTIGLKKLSLRIKFISYTKGLLPSFKLHMHFGCSLYLAHMSEIFGDSNDTNCHFTTNTSV